MSFGESRCHRCWGNAQLHGGAFCFWLWAMMRGRKERVGGKLWTAQHGTPTQTAIFVLFWVCLPSRERGVVTKRTYVILVSIQLVTGSSTISSSSLRTSSKLTRGFCGEFPYSHRQVPQGVELGPRARAAGQELRRNLLYERRVLAPIHLGTARGSYRAQSAAVVTQHRGRHLKSGRYQGTWKKCLGIEEVPRKFRNRVELRELFTLSGFVISLGVA